VKNIAEHISEYIAEHIVLITQPIERLS